MKENGIAKIFRLIAIVAIVCSIVGAAILGFIYSSIMGNTGWLIAVSLIIVGLFSFFMYLWYAEVLSLLQKSVNIQEKMLENITER